MRKLLLIILISFSRYSLNAQTNLDSLWGVWNDHTQPDTSRLKAMQKIAWDGYLFSQPDSAFYFAQMHYDLAEKSGLKKQMAGALNTQGISFAVRGDYPKALEYYQRGLKIIEETGDKDEIAYSLSNIGSIYYNQDDYPKALDYYQRSLKIMGEIGDKNGIAGVLNDIGIIYKDQGDYPKALEYYQRSLKISEEIGDKKGIAYTLNNIGAIYQKQGIIRNPSTNAVRAYYWRRRSGLSHYKGMPANAFMMLTKQQVMAIKLWSTTSKCWRWMTA